MENIIICRTCRKVSTCRAASTMSEYKHPVPCVHFDNEEIINALKTYNYIESAKDCFQIYSTGIINKCETYLIKIECLPKVNDIRIESIQFDKETEKFGLKPRFSSDKYQLFSINFSPIFYSLFQTGIRYISLETEKSNYGRMMTIISDSINRNFSYEDIFDGSQQQIILEALLNKKFEIKTYGT